MDKNKKSIIENALTDYNEIKEAAEYSATKKLAEQFPEKFQNLLSEELNKKTAKESYKKIDDADEPKESEEDDSEDNKKSVMKKTTKKETKKVNEERIKDFVDDVESDTPNLGKGNTEDGDTFVDNVKKSPNLKEEFDVTELDIDAVEPVLDGADDDDEIISMDEIEKEITEMEELNNDLQPDPFEEKIGSIKNQLQEMLDEVSGMYEQKRSGGQGANKVNPGGPTQSMIDEKYGSGNGPHDGTGPNADTPPCPITNEQKRSGGQGANRVNPGGPTQSMIDEEDEIITDADIDAVINDEIQEGMGIDNASGHNVVGDHLPNVGAEHKHKRYGSYNNESVKEQHHSLINENKKLTKKFVETKKYNKSINKLVENYKIVLSKYRNQLKEMALYNTNLAHVNNLLVNESLALTQEDKINIISGFKTINTISESKKKYDTLLNEMTTSKKTLTENVEDKLTNATHTSSKKLDEVVEKTAYADDVHIKKMKRIIESIERHDKKKII